MRNSANLPILALIAAACLGLIVWITQGDGPPSELELGGIAWAIGLAVYGAQGLISVAIEGRELHLGRIPPRLTNPLSAAIVLFALALFGVSVALAFGISGDWSPEALGALAGGGCLILAFLLLLYKEAFVGDEACFDEREDGVPW